MIRRVSFRDFDWTLLTLTLIICGLGLMEIYSTTHHSKFAGAHVKQLYWMLVGLVAMFAVSILDYHALMERWPLFYGITLVLLILVLFLGPKIFGSRRWLDIEGTHFQVSEFVKLVIILALARYFSEARQESVTAADFAKVGVLAGDRKSTRLNSSHIQKSRMPSSA